MIVQDARHGSSSASERETRPTRRMARSESDHGGLLSSSAAVVASQRRMTGVPAVSPGGGREERTPMDLRGEGA